MSKKLLTELFNQDFSHCEESADFHRRFFDKTLQLADLEKICAFVSSQSITINEVAIPAAMLIKGKRSDAPFVVLAQLHGNEPAGLAGIALVMALADAEKLENDILVAVGNHLAARQYFESLAATPASRQETRDAFRCGVADDGTLLPDMNRIPVDFQTRPNPDYHTRRAQELYAIGEYSSGMLDIHTARGNMLCITDHKYDAELKNSPIRSVLTGLADAISAHASKTVAVKTLKTILMPLPNIKHQVGIEAGRHEAPDSPYHAASFTLSLLHTLGLTTMEPLFKEENNRFDAYDVQPRISYADLDYGDSLRPDDRIYMVKSCHALASLPDRSDTVIIRQGDGQYGLQTVADFTQKPAGIMEYAIFQYDEMEAIAAQQVVAVAVPSGTEFKTRNAFAGIFVSKSAILYDKDPAVGPWPVAADNIANVKFCYPCNVSNVRLEF